MLTIFSTPKPFLGHIGVIQRNAIQSWKMLHPEVEVILFGDDAGAAEACAEFGLCHEEQVKRSGHGTKYLDYIFARAQQIARHDLLCYANCDIILLSDFRKAVERTAPLDRRFLMAGRRWNVDILEPWDFSAPDWEARLRRYALERGRRLADTFIDYFVFPRGFYRDIPPFVIGMPYWDNWLIWEALESGAAVVDASAVVVAIHQNHGYSHYPGGANAVWLGPEARHNLRLAPGRRSRTLAAATHRLTACGIEQNRWRWIAAPTLAALQRGRDLWYRVLLWSKPFRYKVGLHRSKKVARA